MGQGTETATATATKIAPFQRETARDQTSLREQTSREARSGTSLYLIDEKAEDPMLINRREAIQEFVGAMKDLYAQNGKNENTPEKAATAYQTAIKTLCSKLDPSFDQEAFTNMKLKDGLQAVNAVLIENGYIISD